MLSFWHVFRFRHLFYFYWCFVFDTSFGDFVGANQPIEAHFADRAVRFRLKNGRLYNQGLGPAQPLVVKPANGPYFMILPRAIYSCLVEGLASAAKGEKGTSTPLMSSNLGSAKPSRAFPTAAHAGRTGSPSGMWSSSPGTERVREAPAESSFTFL